MTARHMISSDSKLGMYESRKDFLGFESIGINHLYRALDVLAESKEELEEYLFNRRNLSAEQILSAYHSLWKIEESFRIMKHTIEVRPVYHWTEKRIRGHPSGSMFSFLFIYEDVRVCIKQRCINRKNKGSITKCYTYRV
ncbi:Mobile element protein [Thermodesulfovibrio sp. N1]|nr:Mobile element protein [Thermodesulfovibrio sp. N1]